MFGKLAEYGRTLAKGSHVMVQGSVRTREYEKEANHVLGSLSEVPALIHRVNVATGEERALR